MLRYYITTLFFILSYSTFSFSAQLSIPVKAKYAVLINANNGNILFSKNPHAKVFPASTTKLATLLFLLDDFPSLSLDELISIDTRDLKRVTEEYKVNRDFQVPAYLLETDGVHFGFKRGEKITLRSLLYILMLNSANDAANVLANFAAGTIENFMIRMNQYLKKIGCKNTNFLNPHGLYHPQHYTTPHDLALIAKKAATIPLIKEICSAAEFTCPETNYSKERTIKQHNKLVKPGKFFHQHVYGFKTGYTRIAGYNLVAGADNGDRSIIAVVNKLEEGKQVFRDVTTLINTAFSETKKKRILFNKLETRQLCEVKEANQKVQASFMEDVYIEYYPSEEPTISSKLTLYDDLTAPIHLGQEVGYIQIFDQNNSCIKKASYYATHSVEKSLIAKITKFCKKRIFNGYVLLALFTLIFIRGYIRRRKYGHHTNRSHKPDTGSS